MLRFLVVLLAVGGLTYLLRGLILTALANPLVVEAPAAEEPVDYVLIVDGDGRYEEAARLVREGLASHVLVPIPPPDHVERAGLRPTADELARRELARHGAAEVPVEVFSVAEGKSSNDWAAARALRRWLDGHPEARVAVLCSAFSSALIQYVNTQVLPERAHQLVYRPLVHTAYRSNDWWRSEPGLKAFAYGWLSLLQARFVGDAGMTGEPWEPGPWLAAQPGGKRPPEAVPAVTEEEGASTTEHGPEGTE